MLLRVVSWWVALSMKPRTRRTPSARSLRATVGTPCQSDAVASMYTVALGSLDSTLTP